MLDKVKQMLEILRKIVCEYNPKDRIHKRFYALLSYANIVCYATVTCICSELDLNFNIKLGQYSQNFLRKL